MIFDLIKAEEKIENNTAKITGVISTEDVDLQGEIVKQKGLDFRHFEKSGVFNYEHKHGASNVLGYPTKIEKGDNKTTIEGVLLLNQPKAKEILTLAQTFEKAGKPRSIGFSVEGQILDRDPYNPHIVTKAKVLNCAITTSPVNPQTSLTLMKSFLAKGLIGYQIPSQQGESLSPLIPQQLSEILSSADSDALLQSNKQRIIRALKIIFPFASIDKLKELAESIEKRLTE